MTTQQAIRTDGKKPKAPPFEEVVRLMSLECDRAAQFGYPIGCLLAAPDGLDEEEFSAVRRALMPAIFRELKVVAFESKAQGLGGWTDRHLIAVFPHHQTDGLHALAEAWRSRVAKLVPSEGPSQITLSVGVAHNQHDGPATFQTLLDDAETGLGMAQSSGGNTNVQWREVETELDRLREELDEQIEAARQDTERLDEQGEGLGESWGNALLAKLIGMFEAEAEQSPGVLRLKTQTITLLHEEIAGWRQSELGRQLAESNKRAQQLERRVSKLGHLLEVTEGELKRVASMKSVDTGISSIYRNVQGLDDGAENAELKREMMKSIFEANKALLGKSAPEAAGHATAEA